MTLHGKQVENIPKRTSFFTEFVSRHTEMSGFPTRFQQWWTDGLGERHLDSWRYKKKLLDPAGGNSAELWS